MFERKTEKIYQVIEVEKPRPLADDGDADSTIVTLQHHPGFQRLMGKLKLERSVLETKLKNARHDSLRDVEFIQSGIFWASWLERQVEKEVSAKARPTPQPAYDEEAEAFKRASALVEEVGS